jgi:hypothetical protein
MTVRLLEIWAETNLSSNNYEIHVCTAVARCFPNILDVMVLENVNLFSDKIERHGQCGIMKQSWISVISHFYTLSAVYISTKR